MQEEWRDVVGYEGQYQVSNIGGIKSLDYIDSRHRPHKGRTKSTKKNNRKYIQVHLCRDAIKKDKLLHRLIAEAFIPNEANLPQVNHKDEDKNNNRIDNLEWCDNLYNRHYGTGIERMAQHHDYAKMGKRIRKPIAQYSLTGELIRVWGGICLAKEALGLSKNESCICACCNGNKLKAHGYIWKHV